MARTRDAKKEIVTAAGHGKASTTKVSGSRKPGWIDPRVDCMTPEQVAVLAAFFQKNPLPDKAAKQQLAARIGRTYEKVQNWFSNQRQKVKRLEGESKAQSEVPSDATSTPVVESPRESETSLSPSPQVTEIGAESPSSSRSPGGNYRFDCEGCSTDFSTSVPRSSESDKWWARPSTDIDALEEPFDPKPVSTAQAVDTSLLEEVRVVAIAILDLQRGRSPVALQKWMDVNPQWKLK
ncbi:hypothetical protein BV25DRAFT_1916684 [Artomyces pyxidatus]|uniref:Uncharacterized protein n=1 Tax=Artomyces pyxidatus TaxID=48021 RepID=A0ACB8SYY8_9AGAM|nr:hypothetical protein BV25DRAFT_1916684 [Artomyces pyxidatus]